MRCLGLLLSFTVAVGAYALQSRPDIPLVSSAARGNTDSTKRFIIEVAPDSSLAALHGQIGTLNGVVVTKVFDSPIFSGVSVESSHDDAVSLRALATVSKVWPSRSLSMGLQDPAQTYADAIGSPNYSVHGMTGVDKLHAAGLYGKGVQVALVGTGVDYTHSALGGCFGDGCKVRGGYDFAGEGCWPLLGCVKGPDSNPMDPNGRGTLAAGVLAGYDETIGFYGVAPESTIYAYKVVASDTVISAPGIGTIASLPSTDDETLIEAFLRAFEDGADIISCAPISVGGYSDDVLSTVASRLVDEGVLVTIGVGETQNYGPYYAFTGTAGRKVLAVASVQPDVVPEAAFAATIKFNDSSSTAKVGYNTWLFTRIPSTVVDWPIVPVTLSVNVTDDACDPLVNADFSATIPLVRIGGCDGAVKQANLEAAGAKFMIFYQNTTTFFYENLNFDDSSAYVIGKESGEGIVNVYLAGGSVTGDFSVYPATYIVSGPVTDSSGGTPDRNGNWGPLDDLSIKPDIAAPGTDTRSTSLHQTWDTTLYGSEAAAAYIAGIAALYIGKFGGRKTNPNYNATELVTRIRSSGSPLPYFDMTTYTLTSQVAPVAQVGGGLVNATKVLDYTTSLSSAKFELNDTANFVSHHEVGITNNAEVSVTYTFGIVPSVSLETWSEDAGRVARQDELGIVGLGQDVSLPSGVFEIAPGQTKIAGFDFTKPDFSGHLPLYSGYLIINSSLGESLSIPYLGLAANLHDTFERVFSPGYPLVQTGIYNTDTSDGYSWSFDLSLATQSFPRLKATFLWGTDELRWDIFDSTYTESDWIYPPVVGQNKYIGSTTYWKYSQYSYYYDPDDVLVASNLSSFPLTGVPRSYALSPFIPTNTLPDVRLWWWLGNMADGTNITAGDYVMRVAGLRPFGDRTKSSDWDIWTQSFKVAAKAS